MIATKELEQLIESQYSLYTLNFVEELSDHIKLFRQASLSATRTKVSSESDLIIVRCKIKFIWLVELLIQMQKSFRLI